MASRRRSAKPGLSCHVVAMAGHCHLDELPALRQPAADQTSSRPNLLLQKLFRACLLLPAQERAASSASLAAPGVDGERPTGEVCGAACPAARPDPRLDPRRPRTVCSTV